MLVFVEMVFEFMTPPPWKAVGCGKQYLFWNPDKLLFRICSSDISELIWKWGAMHLNMTIEKRLQVRRGGWLTILSTIGATNGGTWGKMKRVGTRVTLSILPATAIIVLRNIIKWTFYPFVWLERDFIIISLMLHLFYWQRGQTSGVFLTYSWMSWFCTSIP